MTLLAEKLGVDHDTAELAVVIQSNRQRRVSKMETSELVRNVATRLERQGKVDPKNAHPECYK